MRSYIEKLKKDLEYEAGSKAQQKDREFFEKIIEQSEPIYNGIDGPRALIAERKNNPKARAATFISSHMESVALLPAPMIKAKVFGKQFHTICSGGAYMNPAYIDTFQKYRITILQGYYPMP